MASSAAATLLVLPERETKGEKKSYERSRRSREKRDKAQRQFVEVNEAQSSDSEHARHLSYSGTISTEGCEAHARCGAGYYRGKLGRVLAVGFGSGGSDGRVDGWNLDRGGGGWLGSAKNEGEQCIWRAGRIAWWTLDRGGGGALKHMELV